MAAPQWRFVLTDNAYNQVGEILNASGRQVGLPLKKLSTASLRVRLDNPLAERLINCEGYIKGYRDSRLVYFGPIISAEEVGDANGASISVNSADPGWYLTRRLAGKSATGQVFSSAIDRAHIVKTLIDATNSADGETGIEVNSDVAAASAVTYIAGPYKPIMECLGELSGSTDGFDWYFEPLENYAEGAVTSQKIANFRAAPVIGNYRPDAVFEWGGNNLSNVVEYRRAVTREGQANKVYHYTQNGPDAPGFPTISAAGDGPSIGEWKLLEALVQADILDLGMRYQLVNAHRDIRKEPQQIVTFSPHLNMGTGRVPNFGVDYEVGDQVVGRAVYNGAIRFNSLFRIWSADFVINDLGVEQLSLTLQEDSGSYYTPPN